MSEPRRPSAPRHTLGKSAMGFLTLMTVALAVPAALVADIAATRGAQVVMAPESRLWVEGTSSVRGWQCHATKLDGHIGLQAEPGPTVEELGRAVNVVNLDVPLETFDCRNGQMNGHMRKALKATEHPVIRYRMTAHQDAAGADGRLAVTLTGMLTVAGQEKEITLSADIAPDSTGQFRVTGSHELKMTDFGVKPPTLMFGTLKVHDKVTVKYDILLNAGLTAPAPH